MFDDRFKETSIRHKVADKNDLGDGFVRLPGYFYKLESVEQLISQWSERTKDYEYKIFQHPGYHGRKAERKTTWIVGRRKCSESMLV